MRVIRGERGARIEKCIVKEMREGRDGGETGETGQWRVESKESTDKNTGH